MKTIQNFDGEYTEFEIKVKMKSRWVPHFLGMLKYMQLLGGWGGSRLVSFVSDGDGDFRPKFKWSPALSSSAEPTRDQGGDRLYNAG